MAEFLSSLKERKNIQMKTWEEKRERERERERERDRQTERMRIDAITVFE